jgi:hypothetical protein
LEVVPWFKLTLAGLSPRRLGFDPGSLHVRFVVGKVTLKQVSFFFEYFGFPLSVSFYQYCILIFMYMLLLTE